MKIGFIGIGLMGKPMSTNILKKSGRPLMVFDLNKEKSISCKVQTEEDLIKAIDLANKNKDKLAFIELVMDSKDAPNSLIRLGGLLSEVNGY